MERCTGVVELLLEVLDSSAEVVVVVVSGSIGSVEELEGGAEGEEEGDNEGEMDSVEPLNSSG